MGSIAVRTRARLPSRGARWSMRILSTAARFSPQVCQPLSVVARGCFAVWALVLGTSGARAAPPPASVASVLQVPAPWRSGVFATERRLVVPSGYAISLYARVPGARFMALAPNGDVLVSQPGAGKVALVRRDAAGAVSVSDFATGLRRPHDVVFHKIGATQYVYIAESHQINRYVYTSGDLTAKSRQIVVTGLPDNFTPELRGAYGHELKNIALDAQNKLYVSIASTCNVCVSDTVATPVRGAIYQYNADGSGGRLFARGLRNAEGLALVPGSNDLWVVVNNRDNIAYPLQRDFNGDGSNDYGKVLQAYVDNHPPELFTRVRDGGDYGWPFCNSNPDTAAGLNNMPFDADVEMNGSGTVDCGSKDRVSKGIQAHSAPLGMSFLQSSSVAAALQQGAVVALHGSWNRSQRTGYKVVYFPWNSATRTLGTQQDLVRGWLGSDQSVWGRPVDVIADSSGNLLISDDHAGALYQLSAAGAPPPPPPVGEVIVDNASADVQFSGTWALANSAAAYGGNYRHDAKSGKGLKEARFALKLAQAGRYAVYVRWIGGTLAYSNAAPVTVTHSAGSTRQTIDQTKPGGAWTLLGTFAFPAGGGVVSVANAGTTGLVTVDAVRCVPAF